MNKCECWHEEPYWDGWETNIMGRDEPKIKTKSVCWGTREKDECCCGGDRTKCDFYPEVRKKAEVKEKQMTIDELDEEIYDEIYAQAEADIRANIADGGTSCHWCIDGHKRDAVKEFAKIIIDKIMSQWGCDPAYYWKSSDSVERALAKHDSALIEFIETKVKEYCG